MRLQGWQLLPRKSQLWTSPSHYGHKAQLGQDPFVFFLRVFENKQNDFFLSNSKNSNVILIQSNHIDRQNSKTDRAIKEKLLCKQRVVGMKKGNLKMLKILSPLSPKVRTVKDLHPSQWRHQVTPRTNNWQCPHPRKHVINQPRTCICRQNTKAQGDQHTPFHDYKTAFFKTNCFISIQMKNFTSRILANVSICCISMG